MTPILFSDADNTLWDTDAVYRKAHQWLFSEMTRQLNIRPVVDDPVSFVRAIDQEIASSHPEHLRYPAILLVQELGSRIFGNKNYRALIDSVEGISDQFTRIISAKPALREGVRDGLTHLELMRCSVHIVTEGNPARCADLLEYHHIAHHVKSVRTFTKIREHFLALWAEIPPNSAPWVIGDQLTRDIFPARDAGFRTIYFPSSFRPKWEEAFEPVAPPLQIDTFAEVPSILYGQSAMRQNIVG